VGTVTGAATATETEIEAMSWPEFFSWAMDRCDLIAGRHPDARADLVDLQNALFVYKHGSQIARATYMADRDD
jgi:hypothetical protein